MTNETPVSTLTPSAKASIKKHVAASPPVDPATRAAIIRILTNPGAK